MGSENAILHRSIQILESAGFIVFPKYDYQLEPDYLVNISRSELAGFESKLGAHSTCHVEDRTLSS
jgi:hypothetical protein